MYLVDRTAAVLKPTEAFLQWLQKTDTEMPELTLSQLRANCTVFLLPLFDEPEEVVAYFNERFEEIFEAELSSWTIDDHAWPELNLDLIWQFFELEVHDTVLDLEESDLENMPVFEA